MINVGDTNPHSSEPNNSRCKQRGSLRRFGIPLLLVISSLLLSLIMIEGAVRVFLPHWAPRTGELTKFWNFDSHYGWAHIPNTSGPFDSHGFQTTVRINANGFRGPEVPYTRTDERRRVLVLGDSFVWGFGVNEHEMFTAVLEELVPDLEAVNLGVSGYSTDQELLLYQNEGYKYQADIIVILVVKNDLKANTESVVYVTYAKPVFRLENGNLVLYNYPVQQTPQLVNYAAKLASRSYLMRGLNRLRERFRTKGNTLYNERSNFKGSTNLPVVREDGGKLSFTGNPAEILMVKELLELRDSIIEKQTKAKILVAFHDDHPSFQKMCPYLQGLGISCLWLAPYLAEVDEPYHLQGDSHWNARGHELVGKFLAEAIENEFARSEKISTHADLK